MQKKPKASDRFNAKEAEEAKKMCQFNAKEAESIGPIQCKRSRRGQKTLGRFNARVTICTSLFADMFLPMSSVMVAGGATNLDLGTAGNRKVGSIRQRLLYMYICIPFNVESPINMSKVMMLEVSTYIENVESHDVESTYVF
jgi:hypothetical protein